MSFIIFFGRTKAKQATTKTTAIITVTAITADTHAQHTHTRAYLSTHTHTLRENDSTHAPAVFAAFLPNSNINLKNCTPKTPPILGN